MNTPRADTDDVVFVRWQNDWVAGYHGAVVRMLVAVAVLTGMQPAGEAAAVDPATYSVTIVARQCPTFKDIMANRERSNHQESLRDLGRNSVYAAGQPVSPDIEEPNNPKCTPLDGWRFQFGAAELGRQVAGLSTIGEPGRVTAPTTTVPLLDDQGKRTDRSLAGAITVRLDARETALAQRRALWIQGGTADDPLLHRSPVNADRKYGFGAFRCAIDQTFGDNKEWIGFPDGVRHIFCYYFTVNPVPADATIVVRKEITGRNTATFHFNGSVSYAPGGHFDLTVDRGRPAEKRFLRAVGTWNFTELPDPGYQPTGPPSCTSENGRSTFKISGQRVEVVLAAGDRILCVYRSERRGAGAFPTSMRVVVPVLATALLLIVLGVVALRRRRRAK